MSLAMLQSSYARAVTGSHGASGAGDLTPAERRALADVERDRGLDVVKMLYRSWRLTKVVSLLPLTTGAMPADQVARLLADFWKDRAAVGPYFVEECLAFLEFLGERDLITDELLSDLVAFERARLLLYAEMGSGVATAEREVQLTYRPRDLFSANPNRAPTRPDLPSIVRGRVDAHGNESWLVTSGPDAGLELAVGPPAH